jgi:hypothetical protein
MRFAAPTLNLLFKLCPVWLQKKSNRLSFPQDAFYRLIVNHRVVCMRELFEEVLNLQHVFSSENTPAMERRGKLIRDIIPEEMRTWAAAQARAVLPFKGRLNVQGRDGTGRKTFVPWVRIHSPELSPSAQKGWYVVYLFREDGAGVALCVSHGSTRFDGQQFKPRSAEEAAELMKWAREHIGPEAQALGFVAGIDLGSAQDLSKAYETTTAFSKTYSADAIPDDAQLARDVEQAVGLLGQLYRAIEFGKAPDSEPPELREAKAAVENVARPSERSPKSAGGQGFGLTHDERLLVEQHAMLQAEAWLVAAGFTNVRDVHMEMSCDFLADRDGVEHIIEVKGTTAALGKVLLTRNEVELHKMHHPTNVLLVVHDIELSDLRSKSIGGSITAFESWNVEDHVLTALAYMCTLRPQ